MKRIAGIFGGICLAMLLIMSVVPLPVEAASGSISLSVSSKTVNIGDTITVTVNGSADVEALIQVNVSCSGGAEYTGGGNPAAILEPSAGGSDSSSLTYRATSPGTVTFSASVVQAYAVNSEEAISIGGASTSVTVNNAASNGGGSNGGGGSNEGGGNEGSNGGDSNAGGNNGGGSSSNGGSNDNANKSGDNSLRSLTISPGTLSPAFKYSTTRYTASVGADVTSVAVDAQVSNAKASVESVTGNNNLQPGNNTIQIVVKAENGTLATYTIIVNRGGAASEEPEEEPEESPEEDPEEIPETGILIGGKSYQVSAVFPEEVQLPEEFVKATAVYGGEEVEIFTFPYGSLSLYYLTEELPQDADAEQAAGGCFFYNEPANTFFPYVNIPVGSSYVIVLPTTYNTEGTIPEGYEALQVPFGIFTMDGYQLGETYTEGVAGAKDFYLVYGVNQSGVLGWYQYDSVEGSLQRYVPLTIIQQPAEEKEEEPPVIDEEPYVNRLNELQEKLQKQKNTALLWMCAFVVAVVVAIIVIVNIIIFGRRRGRRGDDDNGDLDYIDFDDL